MAWMIELENDVTVFGHDWDVHLDIIKWLIRHNITNWRDA